MLDQRERLGPVQRQVLEDLLAIDAPRPPADTEAGHRLREQLDTGLVGVAGMLPPVGRPLVVGKSALDALDCEGRFLDRLDAPFRWAPGMVAGTLAHTGIAVDLAGGRARDPGEVVAHAWQAFATSGTPAGHYLAELGGAEADALRGRALNLVVEFRELFPPLPDWVTLRTEPDLAAPLLGGRLVLRGKPDLAIGRALHAGRRRLLLVDLKTGRRNNIRNRADMRFYALLATLKYGVAPFRVATFYLDEASWDAEDIDDDVLEAAARTVVAKAARAVRLTQNRPPDHALRLLPGPGCGWCGRAPNCSERASTGQ
ncbi:MAG: PD-(D/E)XK nuclease family protein [Egibacteraceae bacterium]